MKRDIVARYKQGETYIQAVMPNRLAKNDLILVNWIVDSDCLWYRRATGEGWEIRLVDPEAASNKVAFDHPALAKALASASGKKVDPQNLPLKETTITLSPLQLRFVALGKHWQYRPEGVGLKEIENVKDGRRSPFDSDDPIFAPQFLPADQQTLDAPDGKRTVFVREHNLWVRDLATGKELALTKDGTHDDSYASNRSLGIDTAVHARWSPDSKRLFAIRRDIRGVEPRTVVHYVPRDGSLRPHAAEMKQPRPYDDKIDMYRLVAIDVDAGKVTPADYPAIPLTRVGSFVIGFFRAKLGWWAPDSRNAFFVDVSRGAKAARVVRWDTQTGKTQTLFEETSDTFVRLAHESLDALPLLPLPESNELIWFSERSGWAHLYLYDLETGKVKNPITSGDWLVRRVLHFDAKSRELLIQTAGRDPKISPYYCDLCTVNVDTGDLACIAGGNFEYVVYPHVHGSVEGAVLGGEESGELHAISPNGKYIVTTRSRVDTVPETVLMDWDGKEVLVLETADTSVLPEGWQWPEPVALKGEDGKTDIHAVVFRPPGFSPDKSYAVLEYSNSARSFSGFPQGSFSNSQQGGFVYYHACALAALGFIVVTMDGRGTPLRDKAFSDFKYGDFGASSYFPDRIAALKQLNKQYPYMDLDRVGVTSPEHPVNSVYSLLQHSDFYKVCVQHCLTDPRFVPAMDERYNGTVDKSVLEAKTYPEHFAESFGGKLLMIVGVISQTAADSSFRLVEALQKANKDFDMVALPNLHHEMTGYTIRREWDYLVQHLMGEQPPSGVKVRSVYEIAMEEYAIGDVVDLVDYE